MKLIRTLCQAVLFGAGAIISVLFGAVAIILACFGPVPAPVARPPAIHIAIPFEPTEQQKLVRDQVRTYRKQWADHCVDTSAAIRFGKIKTKDDLIRAIIRARQAAAVETGAAMDAAAAPYVKDDGTFSDPSAVADLVEAMGDGLRSN